MSLSISRLDSYLYWKGRMSQRYPTRPFPMPYWQWEDLVRTPICKVCDGDEFREFGGHTRFCICSTLRWLDRQEIDNEDFQSAYNQMYLRDIIPLHNPMDKADKQLMEYVQVFNAWINKPKFWFYVWGTRGTAKTHILQAIRTALPKGLTIYISGADFRDKLISAQRIEDEVDRMIAALKSTPILLFDDWGSEFQKRENWVGAEFYSIIDHRSSFPGYFPTIVTSNNSFKDLGNSSDENTKRTISRLGNPAYSFILQMMQEDFRNPATQKGIG